MTHSFERAPTPHAFPQLCQRPLNGDLGKPNYNNDYIAPMFRDHLMPARCARLP